MRFATIVLKNALRRPLRSALTVVAIAVAVGTVVSLVGISAGFERSFRQLYQGSGISLIVVRAGSRQRLISTLDESLGARIRRVSGVRDVFPGLVDVVSFEDLGLYGVVVQGWVPETAAFDHLTLATGRKLRRGDRRAVMLGSVLARNLGARVGEPLTIFGDEAFQVVGISRSANIFEEGAMVAPLAELQRLMDRTGQVTGFSVIVDDPSDKAGLERIRRAVEALAPGLNVMTTAEHVKSLSEIHVAKAMSWITSAIALVIGAVGVMNTMVMSVAERTREIGVLRALGWRRRRVIRLILSESVVLSLVGAVVGGVAACAVVRLLTLVPTVNGLVDGRVAPETVLLGFALALLVGLLGGTLPALRASRLLPTEALRHE